MKKTIFFSKLEAICELPANTLNGQDSIQNCGFLDSLALLGLISLFDKGFGRILTIDEIKSARTFDDLYNIVVS